MAGFSDNDIEKSSWAVGKAWARDTLAYRGNNVWKCFSVQDKREGQGEMKEVQSVYKERRHSSHQFLLWTIQKGGHSETMFVLDSFAKKKKEKKKSYLTISLMCQHPISVLSRSIHLSC